jgi:hypothetical protein
MPVAWPQVILALPIRLQHQQQAVGAVAAAAAEDVARVVVVAVVVADVAAVVVGMPHSGRRAGVPSPCAT